MDRRSFLKAALVLAISLSPLEALGRQTQPQHTLSLYNTHTDEHLTVTFRDNKGYIPKSIHKLERFMRCHYNNKVHKMDPRLFDMLAEINHEYGGNAIHVISGYRSPEYNAILVSHSNGVARKSLHMKGLAVDFRIPGVGMKELFRTVRSLKAGGAGHYSEFVHMDTGRVRTWGLSA